MNINELERLEGEEWREHESGLFVSNLGRVFVPKARNHPAYYTYGCNRGGGYKQVTSKYYSVHRLVAQCFIPNPNNYLEVDHINRNKTDNRVENLRWADRSLQMLNRCKYKKPNTPKNNALSKQVLQINRYTNEVIRIFPSTMECGRNGFNQSCVSACCIGKRNTHKGFKWQYA